MNDDSSYIVQPGAGLNIQPDANNSEADIQPAFNNPFKPLDNTSFELHQVIEDCQNQNNTSFELHEVINDREEEQQQYGGILEIPGNVSNIAYERKEYSCQNKYSLENQERKSLSPFIKNNKPLFHDDGELPMVELQEVLPKVSPKILPKESSNLPKEEITMSHIGKYIKSSMDLLSSYEIDNYIASFKTLDNNSWKNLLAIEHLYQECMKILKPYIKSKEQCYYVPHNDFGNITSLFYKIQRLILINDRVINTLGMLYSTLNKLYDDLTNDSDLLIYSVIGAFLRNYSEKMETSETVNPIIFHRYLMLKFEKLLGIPIRNIISGGKEFLENYVSCKKKIEAPIFTKIYWQDPELIETSVIDAIKKDFPSGFNYKDLWIYYICKILYRNDSDLNEKDFLKLHIQKDMMEYYLELHMDSTFNFNDMDLIIDYMVCILADIHSCHDNKTDILISLLTDPRISNYPKTLTKVIQVLQIYTARLVNIFNRYSFLLNLVDYDLNIITNLENITYLQEKLQEWSKVQNIDYITRLSYISKLLNMILEKEQEYLRTTNEHLYQYIHRYLKLVKTTSWYDANLFQNIIHQNDFIYLDKNSIETNLKDIHTTEVSQIFAHILTNAKQGSEREILEELAESNKFYSYYLGKVLICLKLKPVQEICKELNIHEYKTTKIEKIYKIYTLFFTKEAIYALNLFSKMNIDNNNSVTYYVEEIFNEISNKTSSDIVHISDKLQLILQKHSNDYYGILRAVFTTYRKDKIVSDQNLDLTASMLSVAHDYFSQLYSRVRFWPSLIEIIIKEGNLNSSIINIHSASTKKIHSASTKKAILDKIYKVYVDYIAILDESPQTNTFNIQTFIKNSNLAIPTTPSNYVDVYAPVLEKTWLVEKRIKSIVNFLHKIKDNLPLIASYYIFANMSSKHELIVHEYLDEAIKKTVIDKPRTPSLYMSLYEIIPKMLIKTDIMDENEEQQPSNVVDILKEKLLCDFQRIFKEAMDPLSNALRHLQENKELIDIDNVAIVENMNNAINKAYANIIIYFQAAMYYRTKIATIINSSIQNAKELNLSCQDINECNYNEITKLTYILSLCEKTKTNGQASVQELAMKYEETKNLYKQEQERLIQEEERRIIEEQKRIKEEKKAEEKRQSQLKKETGTLKKKGDVNLNEFDASDMHEQSSKELRSLEENENSVLPKKNNYLLTLQKHKKLLLPKAVEKRQSQFEQEVVTPRKKKDISLESGQDASDIHEQSSSEAISLEENENSVLPKKNNYLLNSRKNNKHLVPKPWQEENSYIIQQPWGKKDSQLLEESDSSIIQQPCCPVEIEHTSVQQKTTKKQERLPTSVTTNTSPYKLKNMPTLSLQDYEKLQKKK